ncbi:ATP-binding protein [Streptomyces sp. NPDC058678]|uniref:ATP-binding protein n=1 Tax=Streptomyces sp. NPDC058678 TaxID=3346595 RepID=UPI00365C5784
MLRYGSSGSVIPPTSSASKGSTDASTAYSWDHGLGIGRHSRHSAGYPERRFKLAGLSHADLSHAVSDRAMGLVQLVVSELVTNAHKYAPGPCLLDLEINGGAVEVSVWDTDPTLPVARSPDPGRVGQHGLEIVIGACRSFEMRREPVGKRIMAAIVLADDPGGNPAGRLM